MTPAHKTTSISSSTASDHSGAVLSCAHNVSIDLNTPRIMAILNITPDSFSDAGLLMDPDDALRAARKAVDDGADILDIGGESTRPGAQRVEAPEQLRRVLPLIISIRRAGIPTPISIDTTLAAVATAALDAGANIINDVSAATDDPDMLPLAARTGAALILMHRYTTPQHDRFSTQYNNDAPNYSPQGGVVNAVKQFLHHRTLAALDAGVSQTSLILDPGLGFGKSVDDNLTLLRDTPTLCELGYPVLSALSRKSFLATPPGLDDPVDRDPATLRASLKHLAAGASIFRVHDVPSHHLALR